MSASERLEKWPKTWTRGFVAMLPKSLNAQEQVESAMRMRPITILSAFFRLWSRSRCAQLKPWLLRVLPSEIYALRSGQGADDMAINVSYLLEEAELRGDHGAGLSYDFAKCYDHTGGLMSPSRDGRHRCRASVQSTTCNVPDEIEHIHWHCVKHNNIRAPIQRLLPRILRSPQCFQYAAIPTSTSGFRIAEVKRIHRVLISFGKSTSQIGTMRMLRNPQRLQTIFRHAEFRMRQQAAPTPVTHTTVRMVPIYRKIASNEVTGFGIFLAGHFA